MEEKRNQVLLVVVVVVVVVVVLVSRLPQDTSETWLVEKNASELTNRT